MERCFGTLQDRLVKGLRKAGVKTRKEANRYLEQEFLASWKQRFCRAPASRVDAHRPLGERQDLDSILSHVETRRVGNNYTVSWDGSLYQIPRPAVQPGLRSSWVRVEGRLDGTIRVRVGEKTIQTKRCEEVLPPPKPKVVAVVRKDHNRGGRSGWMKNFDLKKGSPVWAAAQNANRAG